MGASPSGCIDCHDDETSPALSNQLSQLEVANENGQALKKRLVELELLLIEHSMKYNEQQREHHDLLKAKDYLDKQAAKNLGKIPSPPPINAAVGEEIMQQLIQEKQTLEASNTQHVRHVAELTTQLKSSDDKVIALSQQLQQLKMQIVSPGDNSETTRRISELEGALNKERQDTMLMRTQIDNHNAADAAKEARK